MIYRLLQISLLASLWFAHSLNAQVPNGFTYQAVLRMADGGLLRSGSNINVQFSILQTSEIGSVVYIESHLTETSIDGLVTLTIGEGSILSGDFTSIDWGDGPYFVKTEIDIEGGTNFILSSITQLFTVPYAMHAESAETISGSISFDDIENVPISITGDYSDLTNKPSIKDSVLHYTQSNVKVPEGSSKGDLLFWDNDQWNRLPIGGDGQVLSSVKGQLVWKEPVYNSVATGGIYENGDIYYEYGAPVGVVIESSKVGQYAKILSLQEFVAVWDANSHVVLSTASNANNGILNMNIIKTLSNNIASYPAFGVCQDLGNEWYLPAINELLTIIENKDAINLKLAEINDATPLNGKLYWTSTEVQQTLATIAVLSDTTITMTEAFFNVFELDFSHLFNEDGSIPEGLNPIGSDSLFVQGSSFKARKYQPLNVRPIRYLSWTEMNSKPISDIQYSVGDLYPSIEDTEGVVFEIWNGGLNGKIISLNQDSLAWSVEGNLLNANSLSDGSLNKAAIKNYDITLSNFPAFKWCIENGEKWYLPARTELVNVYNNIEEINSGLTLVNGSAQLKKGIGANNLLYWSSSESDATKASIINFKESNVEFGDSIKSNKAFVRAIRTF